MNFVREYFVKPGPMLAGSFPESGISFFEEDRDCDWS
jgi:hypothetical protein